jgi:phospholipid transport system substrate-binding protein
MDKKEPFMIRRFLMVCLLPVLLLPLGLRAQESEPEALVKNVSEDVLSVLRQDKQLQGGDRQRAMKLIEEKIAPHFDFLRMTELAVGKSWQEADKTQQQTLAAEFRSLLVRTYANALTAYRDQTVSFKPGTGGGEEATVRSQINKAGAKPIALDYQLARIGGEWKVYDIAIDSVSLVTNYRGSFQTELSKGGIAGLTKALQEQNRRGQTKPVAG